jgi:hypothetical protein
VLFTSGANGAGRHLLQRQAVPGPGRRGPAKILLPNVDYGVENASWSKDGKTIYFTANMGTHNEIMRVNVATKEAAQLTRGDHSLGAWSFAEDNGLHVFMLNASIARARFTRWRPARNRSA